ncbi:TonB-dependent siderophore receptor subfamily [Synechococcus sp. PCC 7335]|uniref:TonB-dependent siderophore receptor n=1 Tax=Synechococcus sp. (strain ATCC 29403 / PCC 7335) TaxID=91464 RepID=UPI00017EE7B5|nr:TonB-dependent siderophore receptor [Synechococcus sp. PCC 7335]EDX84402.1 TonB-dependent siderophore receptor subfamily [Synechococcus sp. PCC 7335]
MTTVLSLFALTATGAKAEIADSRIGEASYTVTANWMAQTETAPVQIVGIQVEESETGLQITLETIETALNMRVTTASGNALIAEFSNAVLVDNPLEQFEPAEGIALVQVSALPDERVRVVVTGSNAPPIADFESTASGLAISIAPGAAQADDTSDTIRLVVTGEDDEGYNPSSASTAIGTDTPIRDTPFSIQVIPEAVLEDRNVTELGDALETAGGIVENGARGTSAFGPNLLIRGFRLNDTIFRDGISAFSLAPLSTNDVERIEVLRGPASVLFGQGNPGGVVNLVTKQPLSKPFHEVSGSAGSFESYDGALDLSGPLTGAGDVRYRLNLSYENYGSFRDFVDGERLQVSPTLAWDINENTSLDVFGQYTYDRETTDEGIPFDSNGEPIDVPRSRFLNEDFGEFTQDQFSLGYRLNHDFNDNLSLRHSSQYFQYEPERYYPFVNSFDEVTGEAERVEYFAEGTYQRFFTNAELVGQFNTGSVEHELLFGLEYRHDAEDPAFQFDNEFPPINAFNPVYTNEPFEKSPTFFRDDNVDTISAYIQDQITIIPELILLAGLRFDYVDEFRTERNSGEPRQEFEDQSEAFTPRLGIVYKPIEPITLYASYTTSFLPNGAGFLNGNGSTFEPEEGRQFEVGIKTDVTDRLSLTLAAFDIRRQNIVVSDPDDPLLSIQTGEVASRGIDLNLNGEILPGWNVTAAYNYLDAFVSEDTTDIQGNQLEGVPDNQFSLWTTYEIQQGNLAGLGAGLGLLYVGDRPGDIDNSFTLPDYFRTDAALFYKRDNWRAQLNVENLFDIDYFPSTSYGSSLYVNPGAPFGISASFAVEF